MFRLPPTSFAIDWRFHIRVVSIIRQPLSSSIQLNSNSLFHFHCHKLRNLLRSHKDARLISEAHDTTIPGAHWQAHSHAPSLTLARILSTSKTDINGRYETMFTFQMPSYWLLLVFYLFGKHDDYFYVIQLSSHWKRTEIALRTIHERICRKVCNELSDKITFAWTI